MNPKFIHKPSGISEDLTAIAYKVNEVLRGYSDKDWNYSRISLELRIENRTLVSVTCR